MLRSLCWFQQIPTGYKQGTGDGPDPAKKILTKKEQEENKVIKLDENK
jgi:hypothetical protein